MKCNIGKTDRLVRVVVGLTVIIFGIIYGPMWVVLGAALLLTAVFQFCPIYVPLGISTVGKT
jgi:hypothetical protein